MKTPPRKIAPLSVWIVGHPQNPLIHSTGTQGELAIFYKKKDADAFKRKNDGTFYRVYRATIIRDGQGPDYKLERAKDADTIARLQDMVASLREENAEIVKRLETAQQGRINAQNELTKQEHAHAETEQKLLDLQKQIHDGKIWNKENPRWTPRTQAALGLAAKEAIAQGATYVGTDHVLLGLLKQGEGIAHRHFLACGMSYEKAEYAMRVSRHS